MVRSNSNVSRRFNHSGKLLLALFIFGAAAIQLNGPEGNCAVCIPSGRSLQESSNDPTVQLTRARERADATQKAFESIKRLSEKGSTSQRALRRADMQRKVALLDYSSLLKPTRREKNLMLKAEVVMRFHSQELEVMKALYSRGSISEVVYQRFVSARDIAAANLKAAKSATQTQRKIQAVKAAQSKFETAQKEFEIANRLFQSRAISQSALDRAVSKLKIASAELKASKQSLGARAVQVKQ